MALSHGSPRCTGHVEGLGEGNGCLREVQDGVKFRMVSDGNLSGPAGGPQSGKCRRLGFILPRGASLVKVHPLRNRTSLRQNDVTHLSQSNCSYCVDSGRRSIPHANADRKAPKGCTPSSPPRGFSGGPSPDRAANLPAPRGDAPVSAASRSLGDAVAGLCPRPWDVSPGDASLVQPPPLPGEFLQTVLLDLLVEGVTVDPQSQGRFGLRPLGDAEHL